MRLDNLLQTMLRAYFMIVTGTVISIFVSCLLFNPDAVFTLADFGKILLLALFADLPMLLLYSRRELGKKQMRIRQILHMLILFAVLAYFLHTWDWVHMDKLKNITYFTVQFLVIYFLIKSVLARQDKRLAEELNDQLQKRYHS